jgi:hypothetical protein
VPLVTSPRLRGEVGALAPGEGDSQQSEALKSSRKGSRESMLPWMRMLPFTRRLRGVLTSPRAQGEKCELICPSGGLWMGLSSPF